VPSHVAAVSSYEAVASLCVSDVRRYVTDDVHCSCALALSVVSRLSSAAVEHTGAQASGLFKHQKIGKRGSVCLSCRGDSGRFTICPFSIWRTQISAVLMHMLLILLQIESNFTSSELWRGRKKGRGRGVGGNCPP